MDQQAFTGTAMQQLQRAKVVEDLPARLQAWFRSRIEHARDVELVSLARPGATSGMSAEIFIVTLRWNDATTGDASQRKFVVRADVNASTNACSNTNHMIATLKLLGRHVDLPIPKLHWAEHDRGVIGGPFCVMEFLDGVVAPDSPPFTTAGWFFDASVEQRRAMYRSGIRFLTRLHQVDWERIGLDFLVHDEGGVSHTEWLLDQAIAIYDQAVDGARGEFEDAAIRWLKAGVPADQNLRLSWSDSRPANMLWRDFELVGALDWEMCTLLNPAYDLSVWLYTDHLVTRGMGIERLPGMLERNEFLETYESMAGTPLRDVPFYEVLCAFRCHAVVANMIAIWERGGQHLYGPGITVRNSPTLTSFRDIALPHL